MTKPAKAESPKAPNFAPLRDRLLVRQDDADQTFGKRSRLVKPDSTQEKPPTGVVVAVGEGRLLASGELAPLVVRVGDHVHFKRHARIPIELETEAGVYEEFVLLKEDDVLGVVKAR